MRHLLIAPLILVLGLAPARAQEAVLRAALKEGDTLRYDLKAALSTARAENKDAARLEQETRVRLTVADVDRDGNATVRLAFETLKARLNAGDKEMTYEPEQHPAEGGASPLAKVYQELATSILELRISPEGTIEEVSGPEGAVRAAGEAGFKSPERVLGVLSVEALPTTLAPIFALDESGLRRRAGDSWSVGRDVPLLHPYTARIEARYTLKSLAGGIAEASGPLTATLRAGRKSDAAPVLEIADQSGSVSAKWDAAGSRLISRTAEQQVSWKATLALKEPMTAATTTTSRLELKAVREP